MSVIHPPATQPALTDVFDCLTDSRCRVVLATLLGDSTPRSAAALAETLATEDGEERAFASDPESVRATLRHAHLPKLAALDLVDWDRTEGTVAPGEHPICSHAKFRRLLDADEDRWNVASVVHGDDRRRAVAEILAGTDGPTTRRDLARSLASRDATATGATADDVAVKLHHCHLPKLASVGLIEYEPEEGTVEATDAADVPLLEPIARDD